MDKIQRAQELLKQHQIDGWLLYDFRRSNPLACRFLDLGQDQLLTRRFYYWIPVEGEPIKLISTVENPLIKLPGKELKFRSWQELEKHLGSFLKPGLKVAMEYAPLGSVPEISRVDGGTLDLIRSFKVIVVSSGDLLQEFTSVWDLEKWQAHQRAAHTLEAIAQGTWDWIRKALSEGRSITEYDVQQRMLQEMEERGFTTDHPPICAVNEHSADPHFSPSKEIKTPLKKGDWILIDLWCKEKKENSVYADITRVGVAAPQASDRQKEIFEIVKAAQEAAFKFVKKGFQRSEPILGYEVDRVCREVIEKAGYGPQFLHRTGHNIDTLDHGPGAHIDDLETHDLRTLLPGTCFSIEPGIYLEGEFGVRLEYDVFLHHSRGPLISGGFQEEIVLLF